MIRHLRILAAMLLGTLLLSGGGTAVFPGSSSPLGVNSTPTMSRPESTPISSTIGDPLSEWPLSERLFPTGTKGPAPKAGLIRRVGEVYTTSVRLVPASRLGRVVSPKNPHDWLSTEKSPPILHLGAARVVLPAGRYVWGGGTLYQLEVGRPSARPHVVGVGAHRERVVTPVAIPGTTSTSLDGTLLLNVSGRLWLYRPKTAGHYLGLHVPEGALAYLSPGGRYFLLIHADHANGIWSFSRQHRGYGLAKEVGLPVGSYTNAVWSGQTVVVQGTDTLVDVDLQSHHVIDYQRVFTSALGPLSGGAFWLGESSTPSRQSLFVIAPGGICIGPLMADSAMGLAGRTAPGGHAIILQWITHYPNPGTGYLPPTPSTYEVRLKLKP